MCLFILNTDIIIFYLSYLSCCWTHFCSSLSESISGKLFAYIYFSINKFNIYWIHNINTESQGIIFFKYIYFLSLPIHGKLWEIYASLTVKSVKYLCFLLFKYKPWHSLNNPPPPPCVCHWYTLVKVNT